MNERIHIPCGHQEAVSSCPICNYWEISPAHRTAWTNRPVTVQQKPVGLAGQAEIVSKTRTHCIHLELPLQPPGERTDATGRACSCTGKWLMSCSIHKVCTVNESRPDVMCCQTCPDYINDLQPPI